MRTGKGKNSMFKRVSIPLVLQSQKTECGLACLAMISSYYGLKVDLFSLRKMFSVSNEGTTLRDLSIFATGLNLTSRPLKVELEALNKLKTPCVLHWDMSHFVVLKSVSKKFITILDPAYGEKKITIEEASKSFSGIAVEFIPTKDFEVNNKTNSIKLSDFWSNVNGLKSSLLLILVLSLILQVFLLASPYYIQLVVDDVLLSGDSPLLLVLALGFGLLLIFEVISSVLRGLSLLHLNNQLSLQLGANLFHHLVRLPLEYFEKRHMGDIVSKFGSLNRMRELLTAGVIEAFIDGIMTVVTLTMIFFYNSLLALIVLISVVLYAAARFAFYRPYRAVYEQEIIALAEENSNFMETVKAIQTIKLFTAEELREGQWQNHYTRVINEGVRLGTIQVSFTALDRVLFGAQYIIVIYIAAWLVMNGEFSTGMLFAFMAYRTQFMERMSSLIDKAIEFKMLSIHLSRLSDIVLTKKEKQKSLSNSHFKIQGKLSVKNLSFKYSDQSPFIFESLNFEIFTGESIAISGSSGCGKSTLLKLMLGLVEPIAGEILIDNVPLASIGNYQYRRQIAAVMQNDELLSGTVADNIACFESNIDMALVVECAKIAYLDDDIQHMAMRYETTIGDMGSVLSGGQKQRLLLARALYKKPAILFLDEATSHLDLSLEKKISKAISNLNITRIIIAHRKETIESADRVLDFNSLKGEKRESS